MHEAQEVLQKNKKQKKKFKMSDGHDNISELWETEGCLFDPLLFPLGMLLHRANKQSEVFFLQAGESE